jgi:DNA mismatch repair protein MutH
MHRRPPPRNERELLLRAEALSGATLGEVAQALGGALDQEPRRAKGRIGQLLEHALGATGGSSPTPDFPELGIELKSVPVDSRGQPRQSTFVCSIAALELAYEEWFSSRARRKLAHVLWVPIDCIPTRLADRVIGRPHLWRPSPHQERALREDWEELAGLIAAGAIDQLDAHRGRYLQVRPKAADGRARACAPGPEDTTLSAVPRGFYLRATFTREILCQDGPGRREHVPG